MDAYIQAFDNVVQKFEDTISTFQYNLDMMDQFIAQSEAKGYVTSTKYYEAEITQNNKIISQMEKEEAELLQKINDAVDAGMDKNSEEWYSLCQQYDELQVQTQELGTTNLELANKVRDVYWSLFDMLQDQISNITTEADFLIDLMSNTDLYEDNGQLTETGMATMGLHAQNYDVYMTQADKYAEEILSLDKEIASDPYNQDLIDRRQELLESQQQSILAAEQEKQAIKSMVEEGINLEIESLKNLIQEYEDSLDAAKDLYDYEKKISSQTQNISDLEKILSSMENDTSEEGRLQRQQTQKELEEARADLEETEYNQYVKDTKQMLSDLESEYEDVLNQRLDDLDLLISDMINMVNENSEDIAKTLEEQASNVGYTLSDSMTEIWSGTNGLKTVVEAYTGENGTFNTGVTTISTAISNLGTSISNMMSALDKQASSDTKSVTNKSGSNASVTVNGSATGNEKKSSNTNTNTNTNKTKTTTTDKKSSGTQGDGKIQVGDKVKYESGRYYYDSYGSSPSGYQHRGEYVYVHHVVSNPKSNQKYPYSIGYKKSGGGLGWVKKSQISGYASGVQKVTDDELAWTQEDHSKEFIIRKSDGAVLTPLHAGDMVLPNYASENIWKMSTSPEDFIKENMALGDIHATIEKEGNTIGDVSFEVNLPNVTNYEEFKYALQHDTNFEKMIQSMTVGLATGGSSLKKYKY